MKISKIDEVIDLDLSSYELVSFDFFDTLVYRKAPESFIVEKSFNICFPQFDATLDIAKFIQMKEQAEIDCRYQNKLKGFDNEASLQEIYRQVLRQLSIEAVEMNSEMFCQSLVELECNNLILSDGVMNVLEHLKSQNKKVVITSDTYYKQQDFEQFIYHLKIDNFIDQVYLSNEVRLNKASGKLFSHLLSCEDLDQNKIIHIGDNSFSDILIPEKLGLRTVFYQPAEIQTDDEHIEPLYHFGNKFLGPVLFDFIENVLAEKNNDSVLVFLGRDSFILKKIFEVISPDEESYYLYINRVLVNQLHYQSLDSVVCNYINTLHKGEGIWGLVSVFGLHDTDFSSSLSAFLKQHDFLPGRFITADISRNLIDDHDLTASFKRCIKERRANFVKYLEVNLEIQTKNSIELVDVGWRGDIFRKLNHSFSNVKKCHLLCFSEQHIDTVGYIEPSNKYHQYFKIFSEFRDLIEYSLSDNKSSILYIDEQLKPVHHLLKNNDQNHNASRKQIQNGILDYCQQRVKLSEDIVQNYAGNMRQLGDFFLEFPTKFINALADVVVDCNIDGGSVITFKDVLPMQRNTNNTPVDNKNLQSMLYCFLEMIKELSSETQIVIYGSGSGADFVLPHLLENCQYIVDINEKIHGQNILGIQIKSIDSLKNYEGKILVSVIGRKNQINSILQSYNLDVLFIEDYL